MEKLSLFGERSLTLVAATFDNRATAVNAAEALRADMPQAEIDLVRPEDPQLARKMEPESQGIWRTLVRTHLLLGPIGLVLGAGAALGLIGYGWPAAVSSPMATTLALSALGLVGGLLLAGLVTLRPDRGRVTAAIRRMSRAGCWAVVAHPMDRAQSDETALKLERAGGKVVRSL